ncbi:solute carrier organic anion transporter family member 1C1-like protein [Labeo rohita]|uniref:Solute carrier organic anion transporter family member n=1 Tax=Labeo rohita TaxID=84645 RepID=A0A498LAD2_LABRO|nr:solute carrier organic anion transporter family member 1C1-like protein [Labeo rohita]
MSAKTFISLLAFCYFTKSLTGAYTKSTITQIERRFEIPSSTAGIINSGFEMGNLLVITVVSYFGAKFHRAKIIGAGVLLMGTGTLIMALPHFIMGRYKYNTDAALTNDADNFTVSSTCSFDTKNTVQQLVSGCLKEQAESSPMWVIVPFGNILRGIGEASIGPLGMSFIDDYAHPENSAFYIGCLNTLGVTGPFFGYLLGSLCANLYVDIGLVNQESVTITPQDSRWVGAWWLGYVVSGLLTLPAALPLWFLPRALPESPQTSTLDHPSNQHKDTLSITEIAKDFGPSLKRLLTSVDYLLYLAYSVLAFNAFAIVVTYTPKIVDPALKSLSVGIFMLALRVFGGIPAPIFFGALIDSTCLKWGQKKCGGSGACRIYDIETFRYLFLGLICSFKAFSNILLWILVTKIKRNVHSDKEMSKDTELQHPGICDPKQENTPM